MTKSTNFEDNKFNKITHTIQLRKLLIEWLRLTDMLVSKDKADTLILLE